MGPEVYELKNEPYLERLNGGNCGTSDIIRASKCLEIRQSKWKTKDVLDVNPCTELSVEGAIRAAEKMEAGYILDP